MTCGRGGNSRRRLAFTQHIIGNSSYRTMYNTREDATKVPPVAEILVAYKEASTALDRDVKVTLIDRGVYLTVIHESVQCVAAEPKSVCRHLSYMGTSCT